MLCYMCHDLCIHVFAMTRTQVCDACRTLSPLVYRVASLTHAHPLSFSLYLSLYLSLLHPPSDLSYPWLNPSLSLHHISSFSLALTRSLSLLLFLTCLLALSLLLSIIEHFLSLSFLCPLSRARTLFLHLSTM